ncbi:MAG: hydroxymethylbilane synthase [Deltaproteobacteria bacterium]
MSVPLRVGTRGSALALTQSKQAVALLEAAGTPVELIVIRTSGDKMKDIPLAKVGGKGLFIKELEEALRGGSIDFAIHSMKDVPAQLPEGFALGAISTRADARDVLVRSPAHRGLPPGLDALPTGARIGTGSLRRRAQLVALRPDLEIVPIRGNVDTRIGKAESGELDAVMLAAAGIARLGLDVPIDPLPAEIFLPSAGQGFLAIEIRMGDTATERLLQPLHDPAAAQAATAERAFVGALDASCTAPVAAWCRERDGLLVCDGLVASLDGREMLRTSLSAKATEAADLGRRVAGALLARGAAHILAEVERQMAED